MFFYILGIISQIKIKSCCVLFSEGRKERAGRVERSSTGRTALPNVPCVTVRNGTERNGRKEGETKDGRLVSGLLPNLFALRSGMRPQVTRSEKEHNLQSQIYCIEIHSLSVQIFGLIKRRIRAGGRARVEHCPSARRANRKTETDLRPAGREEQRAMPLPLFTSLRSQLESHNQRWLINKPGAAERDRAGPKRAEASRSRNSCEEETSRSLLLTEIRLFGKE